MGVQSPLKNRKGCSPDIEKAGEAILELCHGLCDLLRLSIVLML